jgi:hypothetical protein
MKNFLRVVATFSVAGLVTLLPGHGFQYSTTADAGVSNNPINVQTPLSGPKCRVIKTDREKTSVTNRCPGVGGYSLLVEDSDARMSLTVVSPSGKNFPLNFWTVVTRYFSRLGRSAEWRVSNIAGKSVPHALIVQLDAYEKPDSNEVTQYLVIAKISAREICATDRLLKSSSSQQEIHRAADASATKECLRS